MSPKPSSSSFSDEEEPIPFIAGDLEQAIKLEFRSNVPNSTPPSPTSSRHLSARATPFPKADLTALCGVRLVDPIVFTQIFPYVNEMMDHLHVTPDPSRFGFYSGLVESAFAISQLLSIYQWAKLSDRIGRRPVVLFGITGIAISTLLFGVSTSLFGALFARGLAGFFSGNVAAIHSVLGEITDATNQAIAFPIYGLCWPLGSIIGPLIGGTFSNPATKFPVWFDTECFRVYPYLLPCLISGSIALLGATGGFFFLQESLPSKRKGAVPASVSEKPKQPASIRYLWSISVVRALCISGFTLAFINTAFDVIFVLFCYSPINGGGLMFSAVEIGYALAVSGAASAGLQLFFMPFLLRRFDHAKMYSFCMAIWPFCYVLLPGLNLIARAGSLNDISGQVDSRTRVFLWLGIAVVLSLARSGGLAFSISMILVKDSTPNPSSLGATNGLVQFAMCLARAFSPAFASALFAMSAGSNVIPIRYVWAAVMAVISMYSAIYSRKIEEGKRSSPCLGHRREPPLCKVLDVKTVSPSSGYMGRCTPYRTTTVRQFRHLP